MTTNDYQKKVALSLIKKFTQEFKEKTGLKCMVHITELGGVDQENVLNNLLTLEKVEKIFLNCLPPEISEGFRLRNRSRRREQVDIRTMFCSIAYRLNFTFSDIGRFLGKDHTTIIYLNRKADNLLDIDERFASIYNSITYKMSKHYDQDF